MLALLLSRLEALEVQVKNGAQGQPQVSQPDLVAGLLSRMTAAAPGPSTQPQIQQQQALAQRTRHLTTIGTQPLRRAKQMAPALATDFLSGHLNFTQHVESLQIQQTHHRREALTLARIMDLAVVSYGTEFISQPPAEVALRRLAAVTLAAQQGSFKTAEFLEELPGTGPYANLPEEVLSEIQTKLQVVSKIEKLVEKQ